VMASGLGNAEILFFEVCLCFGSLDLMCFALHGVSKNQPKSNLPWEEA
jgi:hypothetical protein